MRQTYKKISANWKQVVSWVKVSGVWQVGAIPFIKVGGTWQQCGETPSVSLDKANVYFGWSGGLCNGIINITSNTIWTCSLSDETNFSTNNNGGFGDGTVTPSCISDNYDGMPRTVVLNFYIGGVFVTSCNLNQDYWPNECA